MPCLPGPGLQGHEALGRGGNTRGRSGTTDSFRVGEAHNQLDLTSVTRGDVKIQ